MALCLFCAFGVSAEMVSPFIPNNKKCDVITLDKETQEEISRMTINIDKKVVRDETYFSVHKEGAGSIYEYNNAKWELTGEMKFEDGLIKPMNTSITIKDQNGEFLEKCVKSFDYSNKKIIWEYYGKNHTLKKQITFPMKGRTCDDVTLIYFLKPYLSKEQRTKENDFYLITNQPQLFKIRITYIENETLDLPLISLNAIKLKLTGEIGIIDNLLQKYMPHAYVWYSQDNPHVWLKYEGLEKNLRSRYIESFVDISGSAPY